MTWQRKRLLGRYDALVKSLETEEGERLAVVSFQVGGVEGQGLGGVEEDLAEVFCEGSDSVEG